MASIGGELPADFVHVSECVQCYKGQKKNEVNIFYDYYS